MDTSNPALPKPPPPNTPGLGNRGASHTRRVRIVVLFASMASILLGLPWAVFFLMQGDWAVALSDTAVIMSGLVAVQMTRRNRVRGAAILLVVSLFVRLVGLTLFFDLPTPEVPRAIHHYLIPLGLAAYLMLKHESAWLRHGLAWGCLATVVFFSTSDFGFASTHAMPPSVREPGGWINNICAMGLMLLLLHVFITDIDRLEARLHSARLRWIAWVRRVIPLPFKHRIHEFSESVAPLIPTNATAIASADTQGWQLTRTHRMRLILLTSSAVMVIYGVLFAAYFSLLGAQLLVVTHCAMVVLGLVLLVLSGEQHQRLATMSLALGLMLILFINSTTMDIPTVQFPRTTHYYFLPVALGTYFLLRDEDNWLHLGLPLACLTAFVVLASSGWGIQTGYVLPAADHPPPVMACLSAMALLYALVHILVGDIQRLEVWLAGTVGRLSLR